MRKFIAAGLNLVFLFYIIFIPSHFVSAQQGKKRVAVLDLRGDGVSASEARTLTERFRSNLVRTGAFIVLEREQVDEVLKEQGFQQSGCVSDECLVEIGRLIGVQEMIGGSIGKIGQTYTIDIRMIDVQTGRIAKTVSEDYRGSADGLLDVLKVAAEKVAGVKVKESSGGSSWLWYIAGGVLIAGAAVFALAGSSSGDDGGDDSALPGADGIWPPPGN